MVSPARQWNTWDAQDPLAMVHLSSGFSIRFSAFSSKHDAYRLLGTATYVTLLEHTADGGFVRACLEHAGSRLELCFVKDGSHGLLARLAVLALGEWGLRYWLAVEAGFPDFATAPAPWRADEPWIEVENADPMPPAATARLTGRHRSLWIALASRDPAAFGGTYQESDGYADAIRTHGYFVPPPAEQRGRWGVLRFNAQMHGEIVIAASFGTDRAMAEDACTALLSAAPKRLAEAASDAAKPPAAARAVRDIVAWNTIWERVHHRPTTVLTRNWLSRKFAGWGVWLDDMLFHALLAALVADWEMMRANLDAALDYQCPDGNLPCLRTANQEWVDRSQSPIGAYILWRLYALTGDRTLLAQHFPTLLKANRWWLARRDGNGDGLIEYGSSPTGSGAYVHTKQAAMDESLMDNHPMFDDAGFDPAVHTMTMAEPGLNSLVALDAEFLARIAVELGEQAAAESLRAVAALQNRLIGERLWDEKRTSFAGRHWSGAFAASLSATSFYPLLSGAASEAQAASLIERQLLREDGFWGARVLPSSSRDDPASADDVYWRGRIWPPHLFLVWEGLRRQGRYDVASELSRRALAMFDAGWETARICRENYHRDDAAGDASPDSDPFYTWGALIPAMAMLDAADHSPWAGRVFQPRAGETAVLEEPGRSWRADRNDSTLSLSLNGAPWLAAHGALRIALRLSPAAATLDLQAEAGIEAIALDLPACRARDGLRVECNGAPLRDARDDGLLLLHPDAHRRAIVHLWWREGRDD